jgi:hypothetical protein
MLHVLYTVGEDAHEHETVALGWAGLGWSLTLGVKTISNLTASNLHEAVIRASYAAEVDVGYFWCCN